MPPQIPLSSTLYFSQNSLRNCAITGKGVAYEVYTPAEFYHPGDRITTVTRVSPEGKKVVVGQYIWGMFGIGTKVRLGEQEEWVPMGDFLRKQGGRLLSHARTFSGAYGVQYRWKARGLRRRPVLTLDHDPHADGSPPALAVFHPQKRSVTLNVVRRPYLEVSPTLDITLDTLILSFLMFNRMKREREEKYLCDHGKPASAPP